MAADPILRRRELLALLGVSAAAAAASGGANPPAAQALSRTAARRPPSLNALPFKPLPGPLPLPVAGLSGTEQERLFSTITLDDRLVVPDGYRAELVAVWGEPVAAGRFGYNNDYLALRELGDGLALLTVNFEYISPRPWLEGFKEATGAELPGHAVIQALVKRGGAVDVPSLDPSDPLARQCRQLAAEALRDLGVGVIALRRDGEGSWRREPGRYDRRIDGLSGLEDPAALLRVSGPAAAVFRTRERLGYDDGLGDRVIGTFANCAGGVTPWGTVLSAEENIQDQVVEAVYADGSASSPAQLPFQFGEQRVKGLGNPFALAGNKYGWMVELDPQRPEQPAVKHSWLGRFRHEAVAVRAQAGEPLVVYSGCDRMGGHLYRFVSAGRIRDPADPANSRLLEDGRLEAARFDADGSGQWIPLAPATAVDPLLPSHFERHGVSQACRLPHSDRRQAGAESFSSDAQVADYRRRFPTLGDLYPGKGEQRMGAILIDAHLAASAAGATPSARPEDTDLDPLNGDLLVAFTAGGANDDGRADPAIFRGPAGEASWPHGWILRLSDGGPEAGSRFRWSMASTGGTPWQGGAGFSNPDNLAFDRAGNLWMVTDHSGRGSEIQQFGNNGCWLLPRSGPAAGEALLFATGPMECELCGPCFDAAETSLFLAVQHPGEVNGTRAGEAREGQGYPLVNRDGRTFEQLRWVPLGSNWPSGVPGRPPRPGVVAIRRLDSAPLLAPASPRPSDP